MKSHCIKGQGRQELLTATVSSVVCLWHCGWLAWNRRGFIMGPLFLELGCKWPSAAATFGMTFSPSMSVVEFYLPNGFPVPYALYFIAVAVIAAFTGTYIMNNMIASH
ncbi:hypothetical protein WN944_000421 [Citrus x changshan-huyou]|uniref:Uncharacterized protein n=1 Tax=Citrus x changshan-huyou TaxID=2935761 RepID=A0AAP0MHA4_9ROSI